MDDWRTSTVLSLVNHIQKSGDVSLYPILADAMQDGGCNDLVLLARLRSDQPNGWVISLILDNQSTDQEVTPTNEPDWGLAHDQIEERSESLPSSRSTATDMGCLDGIVHVVVVTLGLSLVFLMIHMLGYYGHWANDKKDKGWFFQDLITDTQKGIDKALSDPKKGK